MNQIRKDFLADEVRAVDLSEWVDILPARYTVLNASLFGDVFLRDDDLGAVHMLEVSAASISHIANSEGEFREKCILDEDGWLLRLLADKCWDAGIRPNPTQCYGFRLLPIFGGEYSCENIVLISWREWFDFTADIFKQTQGLKDGARVLIEVNER